LVLLSWVVYPLVVAALGAGWGVLVEQAGGTRVRGALLIPLGLAAVIVVAGLLTLFTPTAPAAIVLCAVAGAAGLVWGRPWQRLEPWGVAAAVGALLAYGAPVILSGHATFLGYLRLDDTATWFDIVDHLTAHVPWNAGPHASTYALVYTSDVGRSYPRGAFMALGVSRGLTGIDVAWIFQPYLACCGAAIAACVYSLASPLLASPRRRAAVAFLAAQPALLYGYSLWGGVKELTSAMLLVLGVTLIRDLLARPAPRGRELLALAVAAGALLITLSAGAVAWMVPAMVILLAGWMWRAHPAHSGSDRRQHWWRGPLASAAWVTGLTAACAVPLWAVIGTFLSNDAGLFSSGQSTAIRLGNLLQPLSGFQLAGVWTVGDFRVRPGTFPTTPLVVLVILAVLVTLAVTVRRGQSGPALYVGVALAGCAISWLVGSTPWVMGKALAISSPALMASALIGAAMLSGRTRLGLVVLGLLGLGVIWSNVLGYHDALLAPRDRLAELQRIGELVAGKGPTFINDYEVYGDRHFLRQGAPTEPAEYRTADLPTSAGVLLTKSAYADLDSFPLSTLLPYRSIVVRDSPVESRPPAIYRLIWRGRYYALYQRPADPSLTVARHVSLGDQNVYPYCGAAEGSATLPLCSVAPAAVPPCRFITGLVPLARRENGHIVAYQRPAPIVLRGDQTQWPGAWAHDTSAHSLSPTRAGTATAHIQLASAQDYELWLGGSFARGFEVSVDGRDVGRVENEISDINGYVPVARLHLTPGVHSVGLTYPRSDLAPGSGDNTDTTLNEIALQPLERPQTTLLSATPADARSLCGRMLDWVEVVAPA
jgi:hypothetical protein